MGLRSYAVLQTETNGKLWSQLTILSKIQYMQSTVVRMCCEYEKNALSKFTTSTSMTNKFNINGSVHRSMTL
jgi:hypothetical protein